ncbi:hypothetical protein ASC94_11090 [Massilia sp. Root418]|nr:hypothetical protein ASC94_11090 [Massilia sp. Root418]
MALLICQTHTPIFQSIMCLMDSSVLRRSSESFKQNFREILLRGRTFISTIIRLRMFRNLSSLHFPLMRLTLLAIFHFEQFLTPPNTED